MKKVLFILSCLLLTCSCRAPQAKNSEIIQVVEEAVRESVNRGNHLLLYISTSYLCNADDYDFYKSECVEHHKGNDDYLSYYYYNYLTRVKDNKVIGTSKV